MSARFFVGLAALALALGACSSGPGGVAGARATGARTTALPTVQPRATTGAVVAAAGDISCDPGSAVFSGGTGTPSACRMMATSDVLVSLRPDAVLALGDTQYENGALAKFRQSYDPTWGRLKAITHPAVGNHEYLTPSASGYFDYFGAAAGDPAKGYYSFDVGAWHLIALNSNCAHVGGCDAGSPQEQWLRADLAAHPAACTLAYWHHPLFSSGQHGGSASTVTFWRDLSAAGAEIVLNGHDHNYERFAPQNPGGAADPARGIREFVVGTGGDSLRPFRAPDPNSVVRAEAFGALVLTLHPNGYEWRFAAAQGGAFTDSGTGTCH